MREMHKKKEKEKKTDEKENVERNETRNQHHSTQEVKMRRDDAISCY